MPISNQDSQISIEPSTSKDQPKQQKIVASLLRQLGESVIEMWFDSGRTISVRGPLVQVSGSSEFQLCRIRSRFNRELQQAIFEACGADSELRFELVSVGASPTKPATEDESRFDSSGNRLAVHEGAISLDREQRANHPVKKLSQHRRGLDSFVFGQGNRLLEAGIGQMFGSLGQMSPLVVYGPTGCGKSHLLQSLIFDGRRKHNLSRCIYLSAEQFTSNFVEAIRSSGLPSFRRKYRDLDILAIDDVQFFAGKQATLAEFQHTIDNLTQSGKQVVLSSDRPPIELSLLGSEITTRMTAGLPCPLNYPDVTGRKQIISDLCRSRGINICESVVDVISENLARDVRRLFGAVNRLHAHSLTVDGELTLSMAKQVLADLFSMHGNVTTISRIEKVVCEFCGVTSADLKSSSRQKKISAARMLAMYLSRQYTPNACSEIGEYFGGRKHSTVIAAEKKVSAWLHNNQAIDLPHAKYPAKDALVRIESALCIG